MNGKLYGLGVGPGDPELITLKAVKILKNIKVIAYPSSKYKKSFARAIAGDYIPGDVVEIPIILPMLSERLPASRVYDRECEKIASFLSHGKDVAVLCEGDPFFYGSFMYIYERLANRYVCEVIPGISSVMASAAALARPLAARNDVVSIIPATLPDTEITAQLSISNSVAIIKIGRHFFRIFQLIKTAGLTDKSYLLENVSLDKQRIVPLSETIFLRSCYFSIILIYRGCESCISKFPNFKKQK